uniref:Piezo_RRas_bdg domain-containing protein n=1 Tax=Strongyloides venezuelensis TaxID=75913 RepID=A0A0K0FWJ2_STRVS
ISDMEYDEVKKMRKNKIDIMHILIDSKKIDDTSMTSSALRSIFMYNMIDKLFPKRKNDLKFLRKEKIKSILHNTLFIIIMIIFGCFHPTISSLPYLILSSIYILSWILNKTLNSWHWSIGRRLFLLYTSLYILMNYCYQFESINSKITQDSLISRLFGLVIYQSPQLCINIIKTQRVLYYFWPEYLSPLLGFILYNIVSFQYINMSYFEVIDLQIQNKRIQLTTFEKNDSYVNENYSENERKKLRHERGLKRKELKYEHDKKILENIDNIVGQSNLCVLITSHSYFITLFTMIGWSMLYRSWSTFVLLAIACIIWISPNSKKTCLRISLFVGIYSIVLVIVSFIYSFQLTEEELPDEHPTFLRQIGLEKPREFSPCLHLYIKITFSFFILLSYRQKIVEFNDDRCGNVKLNDDKNFKLKQKISHVSAIIRELPFEHDSIYKKIKKFFFQNVLIWIVILLLNASINNEVVIYRIIYMVFFLIFINMFFITFTNWRRFLYTYLMSLIIYSATVLVLMYTYQFHGLPNFYKEYLGFSDEVIKSIGLTHYSAGELIISILTPLSFLILALIQLNFFHSVFIKRTEKWYKTLKLMRNPLVMPLKRLVRSLTFGTTSTLIYSKKNIQPNDLEDQQSQEGSSYNNSQIFSDGKNNHKGSHRYKKVKQMMTKMERNIKTIYAHKTKFVDVLWRFAEIHFDKIVAIFLAYGIFHEMSFINIPFIVILITFPPGNVYFDESMKLCAIWDSIIILMKLVYQLPVINVKPFEIDCTSYMNITTPAESIIKNNDDNLLEILGVKKSNDTIIEEEIFINPINWIGLQKVDDLYRELKNYIIF